jgi:DNA-binding transcriptional ArsR family regulator
MDAIALLADATRRRIVELLTEGELSAGEIAAHFEIARPGVSRHLRQLREGGLVSARRSGQQQIYRLEADQLKEVDRWLAPIRAFWNGRLDALDTEVRRGRKAQREALDSDTSGRDRRRRRGRQSA